MDSYTLTHQCWQTSKDIRQLGVDTGCRQERWPIGMDDMRESKEFMLLAHINDDDDARCYLRKNLRGVMAKGQDCEIVVSKFETHSHYIVQFRIKTL